jgi:Lon protease-like protein
VAGVERELPLFPLEQVVLFPGMPLPLRIFEERYKVMIAACQLTDQLFGVCLIRSGREVGQPATPERVGCTARMIRVDRLPNGQMHILAVGEQRFRLSSAPRVAPEGYLVGDVKITAGEDEVAKVPSDLTGQVTEEFRKYRSAALKLAGRPHAESQALEIETDPVRLSFQVAASLQVHPRERQHLLALDDAVERLQRELAMLRRENRPPPPTIGPFSVN